LIMPQKRWLSLNLRSPLSSRRALTAATYLNFIFGYNTKHK
jgi:hypothetical protein